MPEVGRQCQFRRQACRKLIPCSIDLETEVASHIKEYGLGREVAEKVEGYNWKRLSKYCTYGGKG